MAAVKHQVGDMHGDWIFIGVTRVDKAPLGGIRSLAVWLHRDLNSVTWCVPWLVPPENASGVLISSLGGWLKTGPKVKELLEQWPI